ncbi:GNAT family N-acetyltransferase [Maribellus sediminis]|uniref:GNAT family N-acetyltransferase n=1 Tax=Maribellus sediminis TaxID=2696285 RepID=UPI0019820523|nr:GNAT family N-acetyltransferase [Maribellus sediminis]
MKPLNIQIRKAGTDDLEFLVKLEQNCFEPFQQNSRQNIRHSLLSDFQRVLIAETSAKNKKAIGSLTLFLYQHTVRIYSVAILPEYQNKGFGELLLKHVFELARRNKYEKIAIEVSEKNEALINWYRKRGFRTIKTIPDYYEEGEHALKMECRIKAESSGKTTNVIVINQPFKWSFTEVDANIITVKEYINNPVYQNSTDFRIFNLCSSYKYQSYGYYVSLLATARSQRVIPSIATIRDFRLLNVVNSAAFDIEEEINRSLTREKSSNFSLKVFFGQTSTRGFKALAMKLYQLFEAPLFKVDFVKHDKWLIKDIQVLTLPKLGGDELENMYEFARKYFSRKRFSKPKLTNFKYDIAVLVNPEEETPPSNTAALQKLKNAATKKNVFLEFITRKNMDKINEFDALFIRETTNVNDYTYEFSRMAYAEGLVVIDDPWSILKCSNKIYQNEIFRKHKIPTPQTIVFTKNLFNKKLLNEVNYPIVLKQPDSAFSLGVFKVDNEEEALTALDRLFKKSDMVVCQEFVYSDFDWRIGILDNKALFACKYYMSENHWQIYNWKEIGDEYAGDSETLPVEEVPELVLKTALKAAALIGDGLYGVDLKMIDDKVYVVEVNDNPNIDNGIEDLVLGDTLYDTLIDSLINRIEIAKNVQKIELTVR